MRLVASVLHRVNSIHVDIWEANALGICTRDPVTAARTTVFSAGITPGPSEATPGAVPRDS